MGNEQEARFLTSLTNEKLKSQEQRGSLVSRKLGWVTGLFALGAIKLPLEIESQVLLYLVPIVALVFDLYILGENFGIKRMGAFVKEFHQNCPEAQWERLLAGRRDRFSWYALPLSIVFQINNFQTAWRNISADYGKILTHFLHNADDFTRILHIRFKRLSLIHI